MSFHPDKRALYSAPAYEGERCRKCGSVHSGMRYDGSIDVLRFICHSCGFEWKKSPLDRDSSSSTSFAGLTSIHHESPE